MNKQSYISMQVYSFQIIQIDNNIKLIDQRLAQLRALIPQSRAQSAAKETRIVNEIINLELKLIEAIKALKKKFNNLTKCTPVYKAPEYEHVLADQIINLDFQLISAKSNHPLPNQPESHPPAPQQPAPQPKQLSDMAKLFTDCP